MSTWEWDSIRWALKGKYKTRSWPQNKESQVCPIQIHFVSALLRPPPPSSPPPSPPLYSDISSMFNLFLHNRFPGFYSNFFLITTFLILLEGLEDTDQSWIRTWIFLKIRVFYQEKINRAKNHIISPKLVQCNEYFFSKNPKAKAHSFPRVKDVKFWLGSRSSKKNQNSWSGSCDPVY